MNNLESVFKDTISGLEISKKQQDGIVKHISLLRDKHLPTYEHMLRVGILTPLIASFVKLEPKPALYGGVFHDMGKLLIEKEVLDKKENFNEEDMVLMRLHPEYGYKILKEIYAFSAEILIRHHFFQTNPYPLELPESRIFQNKKTLDLITEYGKIVALADFYDALKSRENDRFSRERDFADKRKKILLDCHPNQQDLIKRLYRTGIFQ